MRLGLSRMSALYHLAKNQFYLAYHHGSIGGVEGIRGAVLCLVRTALDLFRVMM